MQEREDRRPVAELQEQGVRDLLRNALQGEEGLVLAEHAHADGGTLVRILLQRELLRDEAPADLEQPAGQVSALLVSRDGRDHLRHQGGPHQGQILIDGVHDTDRVTLRRIFRKLQKIQVRRREEGIMDRLAGSGAAEGLLQLHLHLLLQIRSAGGDRRRGHQGPDDVVVTVLADQLLRNILVGLHVLAVSRHPDGQLVAVNHRRHVKVRKDADDVFVRHGDAEDAVHLPDAGLHLPRLQGISGVPVHPGLRDGAAAQLLDEVQGALAAHDRSVLVDALLIAGSRVGGLSQGAAGLPDIVPGKLRAFQDDGLRVVADLGIQAAHDAGQTHGLHAVADHQVLMVQSVFVGIQGHDLLAVVSPADIDHAALDVVLIVGVHRLPQLLQDVVRDVDDVGDRIHAHQGQTALHPCRGLPDLHVVHILADEARAEIRSFHGNVEAGLFHLRRMIFDGRHLHRFSEARRHLAGHSEDALAVRTVRGDGDIEDPVVQAGDGLHIRAGLRVLREHQKAVVARARIQILGEAQLHAGAEHAVGIIAAQLSLLDGHQTLHRLVVLAGHHDLGAHQGQRELAARADIVRAAAHLEGAVLSRVHGRQVQVGVRDRLAGLHQADHDVFDVRADFPQFLHLKAAVKELLLQLLRRDINIHIFLQPAERY